MIFQSCMWQRCANIWKSYLLSGTLAMGRQTDTHALNEIIARKVTQPIKVFLPSTVEVEQNICMDSVTAIHTVVGSRATVSTINNSVGVGKTETTIEWGWWQLLNSCGQKLRANILPCFDCPLLLVRVASAVWTANSVSYVWKMHFFLFWQM